MSRYFKLNALLVLAATLCCCALARAQTPRTAPTHVNTESIRTSNGGALFTAIRPRESVSDYRGGFLHIYPGHNVAQAVDEGRTQEYRVAQGQLTQDQSTDNDLLPPLPGNGDMMPEEVMGVVDPVVDEPVFGAPALGGVPADGYYGGPAISCGPCQNAKGKFGKGGKGGKGHFGYHDWNWACFCIPMPPEDNLSINFGAQGFKGPLNAGLDGSFGFHEGFNLGAALPGCHLGIGWQIGFQGVHSNLPGQGFATSSDRNQSFFTWGFFRRVDYGLQGGFVFDRMDDEFIEDIDLDQVRGEISWVTCGGSEFGFFFNVSDDRVDSFTQIDFAGETVDVDAVIKATDMAAFFYRRYFGCCRESWGRIFLGATEERGSLSGLLQLNGNNTVNGVNRTSAFLFGADMHVALSDCWAVETGFTWLPAASEDERGAFEESWNVGFNLVWMPRGHCCGTTRGYYRPLFSVADNGSFLTHISDVTLSTP